EPGISGSLLNQVAHLARPLHDAGDLTPLLDRIGDKKLALLGEASHGTSEFYRWRTKLSQRLIEEHGYRFIAVEGDWPACFVLNQFVKGRLGVQVSAQDVVRVFHRWPT